MRVREHSGMPSNATQSPGALVVDLADDAQPAPFTKLDRCKILDGWKRGSWLEVGTQSQRFGDMLINRLVERTPRESADCFTKQNQPDITVHNSLAGGI